VATDEVDGFLLDRGFQVLLDSYPEARRVLDMPALDLHPFAAGALIRRGDRMGRVADPWRDPLAGVRSLVSGAFTPADAWRMMRLRSDALLGASSDPDAATQITARALADRGFSDRAIESFFRPFFGGVFLDAQLSAPRTWFEFLFGMFATGSATLPAQGMRAIPRQLASALPAGTVRTSARVRSVRADGVELDGGETIRARAVIIATDARHLAVLVPGTRAPSWVGCATLYYAAPASPLGEPVLLLNGEPRTGPVNHVCVPSDVTAGYAPPGQHLVSACLQAMTRPWTARPARSSPVGSVRARWTRGGCCVSPAWRTRCPASRRASAWTVRCDWATGSTRAATTSRPRASTARSAVGDAPPRRCCRTGACAAARPSPSDQPADITPQPSCCAWLVAKMPEGMRVMPGRMLS
jgi:hypothetical protein